jgi:hypothetical protein
VQGSDRFETRIAHVGCAARAARYSTRLICLLTFAGCVAPPESVAPPTEARPDSAVSAAPRPESATNLPAVKSLDAVQAVPLENLLSAPLRQLPGFYYEAQIGDTLDSVAKQYGMPPETLRRANGLDSVRAPRPGQLLFIPAR